MINPETKIMVAGGSAEERDLITGAVAELGLLNVTVVETGAQARKALAAGAPGFVVAAWELPGLGGLRLAKELKKNAVDSLTPILLIVPEHNESERAMAEGVNLAGFLPRPLSRKTLLEKVRAALGRLPDVGWPDAQEDRAERLVDAGRPEEAVEAYRSALDAGRRRLAGLQTEIGLLHLNKGRRALAVDYLERGALADPFFARNRAALGLAYLESGRPAEAQRNLERAAELDPANDEVKRNLADSFIMNDRYDQAAALLGDLLTRAPADRGLLNRMGMALRKQGQYDQALERYNKALELGRPDEHLYFNIGRCYFETGRWTAAAIALRRAMKLNPGMEEAARLLAETGKKIEAEKK